GEKRAHRPLLAETARTASATGGNAQIRTRHPCPYSGGMRYHGTIMASASKSAPKAVSSRPVPRLMLVTPLVATTGDLARSLEEALVTADVAAVILHLADDGERVLINRAKELARPVQRRDRALLLGGRPDLVA